MKYSFEHKNYSNFNIFEENKMPPRAYLIPFKSLKNLKATDYLSERYKSDMVTLLNGDWQFKYYPKISAVPEEIDTDEIVFDVVKVPSMWQYTGYEEPYYVNQRYLFKPNPPKIPQDIPVAIYRKTIDFATISPREIITFLGVAPNLELYINGEYVGYSEGSHNTAEFDITKYLKIGVNEIVALVYKFCNGTYIEAQDMFRSNGIFRDVYITHAGASTINDLAITVKYINGGYNVEFVVSTAGHAADTRITVMQGDTLIQVIEGKSDCEHKIEINNGLEWTAETPNLYTAYVELIADGKTVECVRDDFGLKHIEIVGNVFKFNNKSIKLKGVNHHDTDESKGYYMTVEDIIRDIEIMKEYNCNCVRTSHYPPDPTFIKACSHYGLYVVDEADIEAHGVNEAGRPNWISANKDWCEHYWNRVKRMFERDKNNACITMWSLGNEAGGIACQDYCYDKLKQLTTIPIHYEGACRSPRFAYDVVSLMYYGVDGCERIANGTAPKKFYKAPFYLCEYAHAMGVGPGDLDKYMDIFLSAENMLGGCIWEFADHAVKHAKEDKYLYEYTYGGDHGEKKHDSNFCVDGLFYPDRTPNSGAIAMKNVYRPIRAKKLSKSEYKLINTNYFTDSSNIDISYTLIEDGNAVLNGKVNEIIAPQGEVIFTVNSEVWNGGDLFLTITYNDRTTGKEIAKEQVLINENIANPEKPSDDVKFTVKGNRACYEFEGGSIIFDTEKGYISSFNFSGEELISQSPARPDGLKGFMPNIYRAPIDNYMYVDKSWKKQGLDNVKIVYDTFKIDENKITFYYSLAVKSRIIIRSSVKYRVYKNGEVNVSVKFKNSCLFKSFDLPKLGVSIEIPDEYTNVNYYGRGDSECYSDFMAQSVMGKYSTDIDKLFNNYIKPQDNGNHTEVRSLSLTNAQGKGIEILAFDRAFNFSASRYTLDNMKNAKHREDLKKSNSLTVNIDGFVRGIGSNSCGQDTRKIFRHYLKHGKEYKMKFRINPIK